MTFRVLVVCTGNISRSPMAERLFADRCDAVSVSSAGTFGLTGHGMDAPAASVLRELGGDPTGHLARPLTADLVDAADLVLGATAEHRAVVDALVPGAASRTFTMREFARLGTSVRPGRASDDQALRARVAEITQARNGTEPAGPVLDDIGDPFGAPMDVVRSAGTQISEAVDGVLSALGLLARN